MAPRAAPAATPLDKSDDQEIVKPYTAVRSMRKNSDGLYRPEKVMRNSAHGIPDADVVIIYTQKPDAPVGQRPLIR
jgi:hypothetical protein